MKNVNNDRKQFKIEDFFMASSSSKSWDWVVEVDDPHRLGREHLFKAYHLDRLGCSRIKCKRNCTQKPRCIFGLGEKKWFRSEYSIEQDLEDPSTIRRRESDFCGLKNLGATCYVNSFLQVWFHNESLRKAIYLWNPNEDPQDHVLDGDISDSSINSSPIAHLQSIFVRLQYGFTRCVDPEPFVKSLDLDISQQQDTEEFCKLFFGLLERYASFQTNPIVKTIVQNEFQGNYAYMTTCLTCNSKSESPSQFFELTLHIEGRKSIGECLNGFFSPETLEGPNAYHCQVCGEKRMASRRIKLTSLPPTLNLQLLRFVYDVNKNTRKKLNTSISFPQTLDMRPYLSNSSTAENAGSGIYELKAVLSHFGRSAHVGHYLADVHDMRSKVWFRFDDEHVVQIENKKYRKSVDQRGSSQGSDEIQILEDNSSKPKSTKQKTKKSEESEQFNSTNAYMLVYQDMSRQPTESPDWKSILSDHLNELLVEEERKLDEWMKVIEIARSHRIEKFNEKMKLVKSIYDSQEKLTKKSDLCFVRKDWLMSWLKSDPLDAIPRYVDNSMLLCSNHSKISFKSISELKCLSRDVESLLTKTFEFRPKLLTTDDLCFDCVKQEVKLTTLKYEISNDDKIIKEEIRKEQSPNNGSRKYYWIGNDSFKSWKQLAMSTTDNEPTDNEPTDEQLSGDSNSQQSFQFNSDAMCPHGKLNQDLNSRRLVPDKVWRIFKKYFPTASEFFRTTKEFDNRCRDCDEANEDAQLLQTIAISRADNERSTLNDLYRNENRPKLVDLTNDESSQSTSSSSNNNCHRLCYYLLNYKFVKKWRSFLENPSESNPPTTIDNSILLCSDHKYLLFPVTNNDNHNNSITTSPSKHCQQQQFVLLYEFEWKHISSTYECDHEICVQRRNPDSPSCSSSSDSHSNGSDEKVITRPPHCRSCYEKFLEDAKRKELTYSGAHIYVRKVAQESQKLHQPQTSTQQPSSQNNGTKTSRLTRNNKNNVIVENGLDDFIVDDSDDDGDDEEQEESNNTKPRRKVGAYHRDEAFVVPQPKKLRKKSPNTTNATTSSFDFSVSGDEVGGGSGESVTALRRSTRFRGKSSDQKEFVVSSDLKLKDLKVKIDVRDVDYVSMEEITTGPEKGFKGTRLLR